MKSSPIINHKTLQDDRKVANMIPKFKISRGPSLDGFRPFRLLSRARLVSQKTKVKMSEDCQS